MLGVIVYKLLVYRPLAKNPVTASKALQIANTSGAVCNLICIMILSRVRLVFQLHRIFLFFFVLYPAGTCNAVVAFQYKLFHFNNVTMFTDLYVKMLRKFCL